MDFSGPDNKPKVNGPIGISGWQTGPSNETSHQQTPGVLWGSGEYTKIIGADHKAIVSNIFVFVIEKLIINNILMTFNLNFFIISVFH